MIRRPAGNRKQGPAFQSLEARLLCDTTIDTGYGWKITYPTGVSLTANSMVNGHLVVRETINDTRSNKPLHFARATPWAGRDNAQFFALDITAKNNTGGSSNRVELQLVDFGDFFEGNPFHPRWAHWHTGATKAFSNFSTLEYDVTTATGPMQIVRISNGSVPAGSNFTLNGGANPDTGFRIHMGADYPSNSFSLFQALYYNTQPDRFENNDSSGVARNLGTLSSGAAGKLENDLTLHLKHASSDVDYYKFTPTESGWVNVKTFFNHAVGNVDVQVLNSSNQVIGTGSSTDNDEEVHVNVQGGASYYVKVFAGPGSSSQRNYSLKLNLTPSTAAQEINLYKFNGTQIPFVSQEVFDLGSIMRTAASPSMSFRVRNDGGATLNMGLGSVPNGFIVEGLASQLAGGQEDVFTVRVDTSKPLGTYQGRFGITNNDPDEGTQANNTFGLRFKATLIPPTARVRGRVFNDFNGNGSRQSGENYLANWRVFNDADRDGRYDAGELVTTTASDGTWSLNSVPAGINRQIRIMPPASATPILISRWRATTPSSGRFSLNLLAGQTVNNRLFGIEIS